MDYEDIIWTQGYNFENDLYAEANLEHLLEPYEIWRHQQVRNSVIKWFAFEVEEFLAERPIQINFELSEIILQGELELDKEFCQGRRFRKPQSNRVHQIKEEYKHRLPGKFLFQILARFLNTRGRNFNFNVTDHSLYDIALTMRDSQPLNGLIEKIEQKLDNEEKRIEKETKFETYQRQQVNNQKSRRGKPRHVTKQQRVSSIKTESNVEVAKNTTFETSHLLRKPKLQKPKFKIGDKVDVTILKKDGIKVTVQLQTDNKEEIVFEHPYYQGKVGDKAKLKVMNIDSTGKVRKVVP